MKLSKDKIEELMDWMEDPDWEKLCPFDNFKIYHPCLGIPTSWRCTDNTLCQEAFKAYSDFQEIRTSGNWAYSEKQPNCPCLQIGSKKVVERIEEILTENEGL